MRKGNRTRWTEAQLAAVTGTGRVKVVGMPTATPPSPYDFFIGIDTGVNTGFAVWCPARKAFDGVDTLQIDEAMEILALMHLQHKIKVRIEDARLRKVFTGGKEKAQGVGSVKRDAKILEDFCIRKGIDYEKVAPKDNTTKLDAATFKKYTGWEGRTTVHGRDGAMLVFNYK